MASPAVQNAIDSIAAVRGITQSYVDFTTKLVTDVMNALVSSAISQMRAYGDLVATLERGLLVYKSQVNTPQAIVKWVESRIPETGTDPTKMQVATSKLSQASADVIKSLYSTQLLSTLGQPPHGKYVLPGFTIDDMNSAPGTAKPLVGAALDNTAIVSTDGTGATDYTDPAHPVSGVGADAKGNTPIDLLSAVVSMMGADAQNSYQQLDTLVRMGMIRIVVTDGHILTKMTFQMSTADASQRNSQDVYGSSFAASASAGASWGWGSASLKASYSNFNCHVADEHAQTSTDIQVAMMGEVLVNYKSDYFPQLPSQAKP